MTGIFTNFKIGFARQRDIPVLSLKTHRTSQRRIAVQRHFRTVGQQNRSHFRISSISLFSRRNHIFIDTPSSQTQKNNRRQRSHPMIPKIPPEAALDAFLQQRPTLFGRKLPMRRTCRSHQLVQQVIALFLISIYHILSPFIHKERFLMDSHYVYSVNLS